MKNTNRFTTVESNPHPVSHLLLTPLQGKSVPSLTTRLIFSFILLLSTSAISLYGSTTEGTSTEQRAVSGFNAIDIEGAFKVVLVQGATEGITIEADPNAMTNIITKVEGNTLKINTKDNKSHKGEMSLTINFKSLKSIDCSGSINLSSTGPLKFDDFSFESSGSSKTNLELSATKLSFEISGAGNATLKGSASDVDLDISGSGKYVASELTANNYDIDISGSGNAEISVSQNLDIDVSGSGTVKYKGDPKIKQDISGAGKIEKI
ncbi:MAG TPA: head GIN domain-containing protein [Bacteroidia bacterium]|nr:head GIN domain-containing protein [Bacteroidia bacterium]